MAYHVTPSRVELPIAKNTWINFLKFFVLSALATGPGDLLATGLSREKCMFCVSRLVFKTFQFSLDLFVTIHCLPHFITLLNTSGTQPKPPLLIISPTSFSKKKVWVSIFSLYFTCL